eukprot:1147187-Pelagomonas_calceolata.AAC.2
MPATLISHTQATPISHLSSHIICTHISHLSNHLSSPSILWKDRLKSKMRRMLEACESVYGYIGARVGGGVLEHNESRNAEYKYGPHKHLVAGKCSWSCERRQALRMQFCWPARALEKLGHSFPKIQLVNLPYQRSNYSLKGCTNMVKMMGYAYT